MPFLVRRRRLLAKRDTDTERRLTGLRTRHTGAELHRGRPQDRPHVIQADRPQITAYSEGTFSQAFTNCTSTLIECIKRKQMGETKKREGQHNTYYDIEHNANAQQSFQHTVQSSLCTKQYKGRPRGPRSSNIPTDERIYRGTPRISTSTRKSSNYLV